MAKRKVQKNGVRHKTDTQRDFSDVALIEDVVRRRTQWSIAIGILVVGLIVLRGSWLLYENVRYHYYPLPYEIILTGEEHRPASPIEDVTLMAISSQDDIVTSLKPEIRDVVDRIDWNTTVAVVIESNITNHSSKNTGIHIRRVFDSDSDTVFIESLLPLTWTITDDSLAPINMYQYVVLTFPKRGWWQDEMELLLYSDETLAATDLLKVR